MAIAEGRKGPARGGILDNEEAGRLRALLAEHGGEQSRSADAPLRGLAKFLRRNPTDAERALWDGLTNDRRFAGLFKRQTPVGPHINDFVSFQQRLVIDVVPAAFLEVGHDDLFRIGVRRIARDAELFGGPQAEHLVAPRVRLEAQLLVMDELLLETFLALVEGGHVRLTDGCLG